jgi:hypothetical protein
MAVIAEAELVLVDLVVSHAIRVVTQWVALLHDFHLELLLLINW